MSTLTASFLKFLAEKHEQTGKTAFHHSDYSSFSGYQQAITDLANRGVIEETHDILGTIIFRPKEK